MAAIDSRAQLPTRTLSVPPLKRVSNQALSTFSTVALTLFAWVFNFYAFPVVTGVLLPAAFTGDVLEKLGRGLAMELDASANQVGRPVADYVWFSAFSGENFA